MEGSWSNSRLSYEESAGGVTEETQGSNEQRKTTLEARDFPLPHQRTSEWAKKSSNNNEQEGSMAEVQKLPSF